MLLMSAGGIFIYYLVDRVQEYLLFKKNVSVEENYVKTMDFPAITVCNQNPFRYYIIISSL